MNVALTTDPKKKLLYILGFFLVLFLLVEITGIRAQLSPEAVKALFIENTFWGLLLFCIAYSIGNLLYVPGWIFLVGAVFALGIGWGGVASFVGAICSSIISFFLIRTLGGSPLRSLNSQWADKVFAHLDERPVLSVTILRLAFQTSTCPQLRPRLGGRSVSALFSWYRARVTPPCVFVLLFLRHHFPAPHLDSGLDGHFPFGSFRFPDHSQFWWSGL